MTPLELRNLAILGGLDPMGTVNTNQFNNFVSQGLLNDAMKTNQFIDENNLMNPPIIDDKKAQRKKAIKEFAEQMGVISAARSGNPALAQQMQERIDLRKQEEENKARAEAILSSLPPEQRRIYETFGADAAFRFGQQQRNAEIAALQDARQRQSLKDAGFSDREINLFIGADMSAKDILALRDDKPDAIKSIEKLNEEVVKEYVPSEGLQKIDQAFSFKDTVDAGVNKALGPIVGTLAKDTNAAMNARNVLNENLRERFVNQYSGRPSVYLNQRIDALLPASTYMSEFDAMQKYQEIKRVLDIGKLELEENINSGFFEDKDLLTLQNEYKATTKLIRDLEIAIGNLRKDERANINIVSEGKDSGKMTGQFAEVYGVTEE